MTTPREVLDNFSDSLLADERILGAHEKELLTSLLQHASARDAVVTSTISRAVGEIVAKRAYDVLGESITRRLIDSAASSASKLNPDFRIGSNGERSYASPELGPSPPSPGPRPPGPGSPQGPAPPSPGPRPPGPGSDFGPSPPSPGPKPPGPGSDFGPSPPSPGPKPPGLGSDFGPSPPSPGPKPPGPGGYRGPSPPSPGPKPPGPGQPAGGTAVMQMPAVRTAECVFFDEFLAPSELDALIHFALEREHAFQISEVISPGVNGSQVDYDHRRSRVLMDLDEYRDLIVNRIRSCWPRVLEKLDREPFEASQVEAQITASNDGDYFRLHSDNGQPENDRREITFVYFFHREPKAFDGGELRVYDSRWEPGRQTRGKNYRGIFPQQNQIVFFPSGLEHEITPVECASRAFADSRFTVNGWFHR